jgi:iron complex transport system ATP-binding protein
MSLEGRNLRLEADGRLVLDVAEIAFARPGLTAVVGPNGSGKTSLLRALLGLSSPKEGSVLIEGGVPLHRLRPLERARLIAYLPQKTSLAWPLPVHAVAALGRFAYGAAPGRLAAADDDAVDRALRAVGLDERKEQAASTLSGGEFARLMVARALAAETPYLLADEPSASLDPAQQHEILGLLRRRADEKGEGGGACVVVTLHDLSLARSYADQIVVLKEGKIAAGGDPAEVLTAELIEAVYGRKPVIAGQSITFPRF